MPAPGPAAVTCPGGHITPPKSQGIRNPGAMGTPMLCHPKASTEQPSKVVLRGPKSRRELGARNNRESSVAAGPRLTHPSAWKQCVPCAHADPGDGWREQRSLLEHKAADDRAADSTRLPVLLIRTIIKGWFLS